MGTGKLWSLVFVLFTFLEFCGAITCGCEGSSHIESRALRSCAAALRSICRVHSIIKAERSKCLRGANVFRQLSMEWSTAVEPQSHAGI